MNNDEINSEASQIIDALGGNVKVGKFCGITDSAVSQWRKNGIPKPWMKLFKVKWPKVINQFQGETHVTQS